MSEDLSDIITEKAQGPQEVTVAGMGHSKEYSLKDLIDAAKHNPPDEIKQRIGGGMRFVQGTPPGSA